MSAEIIQRGIDVPFPSRRQTFDKACLRVTRTAVIKNALVDQRCDVTNAVVLQIQNLQLGQITEWRDVSKVIVREAEEAQVRQPTERVRIRQASSLERINDAFGRYGERLVWRADHNRSAGDGD
jgi:hypothetical protein